MLRTKVVKKCTLNGQQSKKVIFNNSVIHISNPQKTDTFYSLLLLTIHVSKDSKESNSYFRALL